MRKYLLSAVCIAALCGVATTTTVVPVAAQQVDASVSFDSFHDRLAAHGDWVYSDRWGEVWVPREVDADFHPYGTRGHWDYTDEYGWTWASDYDWGDVTFHYGRWVNDPDAGWVWIPGYVWSPGWVVWRSNGQYTGWMPMPPDRQFLSGGVGVSAGSLGISVNFGSTDGFFGYGGWYGPSYSESAFAANWVFVGTGHLAEVDYRPFIAPPTNYVTIIHQTTNITNYTVVNNFIVNKSVDVHIVEHASGHPIQAVKIGAVIKEPNLIVRADQGREIQMRARQERPRGNGMANSAPEPSAKVVQSLAPNFTPRNGHAAAHLYTRDTVQKAPLKGAPPGSQPQRNVNPGGPMKAVDQPYRTGPTQSHESINPDTGTPSNTDQRDLRDRDRNNNPNGTTPDDRMNHDRNNPNTTQPTGTPNNTDQRDLRDRGTNNNPNGIAPGDRMNRDRSNPVTTPGNGTTPPAPSDRRDRDRNNTTPPNGANPDNADRRDHHDNAVPGGNQVPQDHTVTKPDNTPRDKDKDKDKDKSKPPHDDQQPDDSNPPH